MGARQSKRSVDITTTPKKEGAAGGESAVIGDAAAPGDGKLERIEESDAKPTTNGIAPHTDITEDKDKDKDETTEKEKDKQQSEDAKSEDTKQQQESSGDSPVEGAEATTPTEGNPASPNAAATAATPDSKEPKKKDKMRKKWSLRSISFSKKDKSKPTREETPKNGDVTKEEPLPEVSQNGKTTKKLIGLGNKSCSVFIRDFYINNQPFLSIKSNKKIKSIIKKHQEIQNKISKVIKITLKILLAQFCRAERTLPNNNTHFLNQLKKNHCKT